MRSRAQMEVPATVDHRVLADGVFFNALLAVFRARAHGSDTLELVDRTERGLLAQTVLSVATRSAATNVARRETKCRCWNHPCK
jgi:hypothetical protein